MKLIASMSFALFALGCFSPRLPSLEHCGEDYHRALETVLNHFYDQDMYLGKEDTLKVFRDIKIVKDFAIYGQQNKVFYITYLQDSLYANVQKDITTADLTYYESIVTLKDKVFYHEPSCYDFNFPVQYVDVTQVPNAEPYYALRSSPLIQTTGEDIYELWIYRYSSTQYHDIGIVVTLSIIEDDISILRTEWLDNDARNNFIDPDFIIQEFVIRNRINRNISWSTPTKRTFSR